eukprot:4062610-Pleurochrysis_carterae.AAC.2
MTDACKVTALLLYVPILYFNMNDSAASQLTKYQLPLALPLESTSANLMVFTQITMETLTVKYTPITLRLTYPPSRACCKMQPAVFPNPVHQVQD